MSDDKKNEPEVFEDDQNENFSSISNTTTKEFKATISLKNISPTKEAISNSVKRVQKNISSSQDTYEYKVGSNTTINIGNKFDSVEIKDTHITQVMEYEDEFAKEKIKQFINFLMQLIQKGVSYIADLLGIKFKIDYQNEIIFP